jgi:hypothetical protein
VPARQLVAGRAELGARAAQVGLGMPQPARHDPAGDPERSLGRAAGRLDRPPEVVACGGEVVPQVVDPGKRQQRAGHRGR